METEAEGEPEILEQSTGASSWEEPPETGPFVLRSLLEDLPLSADGDREDIEINCVEFLGIHLLQRCATW
jgi:hypothetical protein